MVVMRGAGSLQEECVVKMGRTLTVAAVMVGLMVLSACGDNGPRRQAASGCDPAVEDCPGLSDSGEFDGGEDQPDVEPEPDPELDPEGTLYPIDSGLGVIDGRFEERPEAAFDGEIDQGVDAAAITPIFESLSEAPLLYKEFNCPTRLRRVEVHAPTDNFLIYDETNYPEGSSGEISVVGRRADSDYWYPVARKRFDAAASSVVFTPEELAGAREYVAYGVTFASDSPLLGQVQVAEVSLFGFCSGPVHEIAWNATEWQCTGVECVEESNPGGSATRTVTCARDAGGFAHPDFCEGEMPASEGESCELTCSHELVYVGPRPFTYSNGSGWLHEGGSVQRAGPLPHNVAFSTTVEAIEGKPCSILTETPQTYFVGISCAEEVEEGGETLYCGFRCE